jgi:hypothetical protein
MVPTGEAGRELVRVACLEQRGDLSLDAPQGAAGATRLEFARDPEDVHPGRHPDAESFVPRNRGDPDSREAGALSLRSLMQGDTLAGAGVAPVSWTDWSRRRDNGGSRSGQGVVR